MRRITATVIVLGATVLFAGMAKAADAPVRTHPPVNAAYGDRWSGCYASRYAYVRYTTTLATAHSIRPVIVSTPIPCAARG